MSQQFTGQESGDKVRKLCGLYTIRWAKEMRLLLPIIMAASAVLLLSACGVGARNGKVTGSSLNDAEKHRLYAAALAASDSPLDSETFKRACESIGIFDQKGQPNDSYMAFVTRHVAWSTSPQAEDFRRQINTKEKATAYVDEHLR